MAGEDRERGTMRRGDPQSDAKSVKGVTKFWLVLIGVLVVGLIVFTFIFGTHQGR